MTFDVPIPAEIDINAEIGVLGCLLIHPVDDDEFRTRKTEAAVIACESLTIDDFYSPGHREIFKVIRELVAQKRPVDALVVWSELAALPDPTGSGRDLFAALGGHHHLDRYVDAASPASVKDLIKVVRRSATVRLVQNCAKSALEILQQGVDGLDSIAAGNGAFDLSGIVRARTSDPDTILEPATSKVSAPCLEAPALRGLAGEFVRMWEPHTEACSAAMLVQTMAAVGCLMGRSPRYSVSGMTHHTNLFLVIVGQSAKSRKGTSWAPVTDLLQRVSPEFRLKRLKSGLSSGEGLLYQVRDKIEKSVDKLDEKGKKTGQKETRVEDEGEPDKRLLIYESEFASVLAVMGREGSTLSAQIRDAWDTGNLSTLTKNTPLTATGAHISICAHITRDELRKKLSECDTVNGFGNRFLWVHAERSKFLPFGAEPDTEDIQEIAGRIFNAVSFAREARGVAFDPEVREAWRAVYPALERDVPGLLGALTSRGTPYVIRFAMIYALLDCSDRIRIQHLTSALSLWSYCEESARLVFGQHSGDVIADEILRHLRHSPDGLTKTEISRLFTGNVRAERLQSAYQALEQTGAAKRVQRPQASGKGRPTEVWKEVAGDDE